MATNNAINLKGTIPAFKAYRTVNTGAVTGNGTIYTCIFNATIFDLTSSFNTGTGIFTAPITGTYIFYSNVMMSSLGAAHTSGTIVINDIANGNNVSIFNGNPYAICRVTGGILELGGSAIMNLTAGNTVNVTLQVSGGALSVLFATASAPIDSTFGGFLIATV